MDHTTEAPVHLVDTAKSDPDAIDLEEIEALLDDDWEERRNTGLKVLVGLAADDPERVVPFVDDVIDCLSESYGPARSHAALVLTLLVEDYPELVEPAIPQLVDNLTDETPIYRYRAARTIALQTEATPESFVEHADDLIDVLIDGPTVSKPAPPDDPSRREQHKGQVEHLQPDFARSAATKEVAANVLVEVAEREPSVCAERLSDLYSVLENEDEVPLVRGAIVDIVKHIAMADAADSPAVTDVLIDHLDDDTTVVRARAIRALGFAEVADAIEPLRTVAESDPDEDVRDLASETADWLETAADRTD
ncbi:HEAT repeat domain-containing protein [Natronoglomus mannanivorans]|uniref:HEAT repeat domain-containing protein n=1 Tax=Natronoglomus mannanivorans TaxID=2979990 RepID=A0AAP3E0U5_9EURY|nr:HEAT repeat domain-containing protein [Halobacteria archaeon AArc-xg1-1]